MTVFEFVFGLFSIVVSLALAHLLAGVADLIRNSRRVKVSFVHAVWMWATFAVTVGNWAALWPFHQLPSWPAWSVLLMVLVVTSNYLLCYLVTPEIPAEGPIDLVAFHESSRRSYLSAFAALGLISIPGNVIFGVAGQYSDWLRDTLISLPALLFILLPLFLKARWAQILGAIVSAALATLFMVSATNIATS